MVSETPGMCQPTEYVSALGTNKIGGVAYLFL